MMPQSSTSGRPCPAWSQQQLWYVLPLSSNLHSSGFLNDCSCGHGRRDDGSSTFGRVDRIGSYPPGTSHDHSDTMIGRICSSKGAAGEHQEAAYAGKREGTGKQYGSASPLDGSTTQLARDPIGQWGRRASKCPQAALKPGPALLNFSQCQNPAKTCRSGTPCVYKHP